MDHLLDFLLKPEGAMLFMLLVVPGFVSLRFYENRVAGERRKAGEAIVDIIIFSAVNDGVWAVGLYLFGVRDLSRMPAVGLFILVVFVVVLSPIILAFVFEGIQKRFSGPSGLIHPTTKPWDWMFQDRIKSPVQIVFTLSDGRRFGGYWQQPCFASSYPSDEQVFLGEVYNVDQTTGQLIDKIPNHCGILVDKSTIDFIEIFDYDRPFAKNAGAQSDVHNSHVK